MNLVKRHNTSIAYVQTGTASDSVILLHGCGLDHTSLSGLAEHLSSRFQVISPDLRGHGSSQPATPPYNPDTMADDVVYLSRQLGVQKSVVIGHSMGGNVALKIHQKYPQVVSSIVLIDSALFIPESQKEKLRADFGEALTEKNAITFYKQALRSMCLPSDKRSFAVIDSLEVNSDVLRDALPAHTVDFDSEAVTADCKIPLAYIHSNMPFLDLDALRKACPQLQYGQTLGAGHLSPQEAPEQINAMIDTFLIRVSSFRSTGIPENNRRMRVRLCETMLQACGALKPFVPL